MSNRFDNKRLVYVLAGLIVLLAVTFLVRIPHEKATLPEKLFDIDTSRVQSIVISPRAGEGSGFEFARKAGRWIIRQDNIEAVPERDAVENIMMLVKEIKPSSLEAVDKSKWKDFSLTDSLGTRVRFLDDRGKMLADLMIGRFSYNQPSSPYSNPYGGNVQGTSFVRLTSERKVYGVDGFLSLSFSGKFNDYRDKSFLHLKKEDISHISFTLPSDSSFVLAKKDSAWYAGSARADSLATAGYLSSLSYLNGQDFRDGFKPAANPSRKLSIEGNNLLNITISCYDGDNENEFILNSSLNPDAYFISKRDGLYDKLFKPEKYFLTHQVKVEPKKAKKQH